MLTGSFHRLMVNASMDYYKPFLAKKAVNKSDYLVDRGGSCLALEDRTRLKLRPVTWLSLPPVYR